MSTEAQKKASIKWQKNNYSRIPLDVPKEYHEYLKARAKADGKTLGGWIKEAIELKANYNPDEIPPEIITNSINWLKNHNHTDEDITDFLTFLSKKI